MAIFYYCDIFKLMMMAVFGATLLKNQCARWTENTAIEHTESSNKNLFQVKYRSELSAILESR